MSKWYVRLYSIVCAGSITRIWPFQCRFYFSGARTLEDTLTCVLFSVGSRPHWSSTAIITPVQFCLSFRSARTYDDTPKRVLFFVSSRPFWSSTTIVKPFQSCLSFYWCQYNCNYPFLVLLFLPPAHTPSPAGMAHRTRTQIKWILSLIQACYCTNSFQIRFSRKYRKQRSSILVGNPRYHEVFHKILWTVCAVCLAIRFELLEGAM